MKRKQIIKVFTDLKKLKEDGIWFSGIEGEGEYKEWYKNGKLYLHYNYNKEGKRDGDYKQWHNNGQLNIHILYKNDKLEGKYKEWYSNGQLEKEGIAIGGNYYNPIFKPSTFKEYDKSGNLI